MTKKDNAPPTKNALVANDSEQPFVLYTNDDEQIRVKVLMREETIWLTQKGIAELFQTSKQNVSIHLKNIFTDGELEVNSVVKDFFTTAEDGKNYEVMHYNLDAIIAVGYRVNSKRATQFRIWATNILKEFIKKGFVLDDDRLKQGEQVFGEDYFLELLERVRSIRASERRIYQQITDIFAECSIDYDPHSDTTKDFYAMVQNKFHFAITGHTAAEIIYTKADRNAPHAGLMTWKNAPKGRVLASDVTVAKNYLDEKSIKKLERTVSGFFDYVENLIENRVRMTMQDMAESVDKFLTFNEYRILKGKGRISKPRADKKALEEYKEFNKTQKIESDFDKEVKKLTQKKPTTKKKKDQ
jgi:hypothetical protein